MRLRDILILYLFLALNGLWSTSCALLKSTGSKTIVTIDGTPVSTEEFLYVYNKNNLKEGPVSRDEITEYLDLFINFKLKVREAEALGLDKDSIFIKELEGYRKQLASPYLTETKLMDSLARVTYERLKEEVSASHILLQVAAEAPAADTSAVFERITDLRKQILAGQDFSQVARDYSEDPSAKQNNGNLGYFSAMQMVYPFEKAVFQLSIDSVSQPVRTKFGYHLIKLHDRRPSHGRIQVSHILVRAHQSLSSADSTLAANRAWEIYQRANNQDDWDLLCRQFSEDVGTKMKGGTLPWFKTGDVSNIPSFEKAAFELGKIGAISQPVHTAYGWHIIRLDGKQSLEPFEELEQKIRSSLTAASRTELNQQVLVKRLKSENNFREKQDVIDEAVSFANDSLAVGNWQPQIAWGNQSKTLFSIMDQEYQVRDFYQYVQGKQPLAQGSDPVTKMKTAYVDFSRERLIQYEDDHLADKYYDYKMLLKEYRDGILLFQLMETKVWNQAISDTSGLRQYFGVNRDRYQWESRAVANIFNLADENALKVVQQFLERGYFIYSKYDFYGAGASFNKAQVKILDNVSHLLQHAYNRYLILQFDSTSSVNRELHQNILGHLDARGIDGQQIKVQHQVGNTLEFLVYITSASVKDLEENMNKKNPLTIQVVSGTFEHGDNPVVDQVNWEKDIKLLEIDDRFILVDIKEILPAEDQTLEEIKGQVISDYQNRLEKEWVAELRNKYQVDIHENQVDAVYEQYKN